MKKNFEGLSNRNSNIKKGKDLLFSKPLEDEQNTLNTQKQDYSESEKIKFFNVPLPVQWHEKLKYDLAKDTGKSVKELILDALAKTYGF